MRLYFLPVLILLSTVFGCSNQKIKLDRIIFHTSQCFGTCPVYHLEVKSDQTFKLFREVVYKPGNFYQLDEAKNGYFVGRVNDSTFKKLNKISDSIRIDTLKFNNETCCDGTLITILASYNGNGKNYLRSMFPPANAAPLISVLYEICEQSNAKRVHEKFEIEGRQLNQ